VERPQNGLIGFDWVRLSAPAGLTLNGYTTPAAVRRNSCFFELGGSWNEGRSVSSKNDAELSEIIMEINDLRRMACAPDRPEHERRRYCNRAFFR
jgi:hypothetical protein